MKKYLFGLGAMLVGAGLMFVLMHGEVSAEGEKARCELLRIDDDAFMSLHYSESFSYCKIKDLTCVSAKNGLWCVKS